MQHDPASLICAGAPLSYAGLDPEVRRPIGRPFLRRASILLCAMKDTIFIALRGKGGEEIASAYYLGIL